jgi:PEP-CTERM/exosortase A-associated glycosyltransferase
MTRVLHVLDHSLPLHSGYTFRTRAILRAQEADGIEVRSVTGQRQLAWGGAEANHAGVFEGLRFERTVGAAEGPPGLREWREVAALSRRIEALCREWRPDVLHAHSPALCGLAALRAGRALGIPLIYEIRAFWEDAAAGNGTGSAGSVRFRLTRALENRVVAGADAVVTICQGLSDDLAARGTPRSKLSIMPNGVDLDMFGTALPRDADLADQLDLGEGPVIGFLGSYYPYEGLDDLIAAMPAIVARQPGAGLLLVGGGPAEAALRAQAESSPAASAIRFVGRVPHHQVDRYYSLVDVVCYPRKAMRLTELVTPLKPLEAMAQGKLVAASDVGGHRELIADGETGTLFAPGDPASLAAAVAELLAHRDLWPARRAIAQAFVAREHDWARNVRRYRDVYQRVLGNQPDRAAPAAA